MPSNGTHITRAHMLNIHRGSVSLSLSNSLILCFSRFSPSLFISFHIPLSLYLYHHLPPSATVLIVYTHPSFFNRLLFLYRSLLSSHLLYLTSFYPFVCFFSCFFLLSACKTRLRIGLLFVCVGPCLCISTVEQCLLFIYIALN